MDTNRQPTPNEPPLASTADHLKRIELLRYIRHVLGPRLTKRRLLPLKP